MPDSSLSRWMKKSGRRQFRPSWGVSFVVLVSCSSQVFPAAALHSLRAAEKLSGFGTEGGARCTGPASSAGQAVRVMAELLVVRRASVQADVEGLVNRQPGDLARRLVRQYGHWFSLIESVPRARYLFCALRAAMAESVTL
jgi:hypothetical protein